jgi:hypothetical protein
LTSSARARGCTLLGCGTVDITQGIIRQSGVRGLYAGVAPAVCAMLPTSAASFVVRLL